MKKTIYAVNRGSIEESGAIHHLKSLVDAGYIDSSTAFNFVVDYKQDCLLNDPRCDKEIFYEKAERVSEVDFFSSIAFLDV